MRGWRWAHPAAPEDATGPYYLGVALAKSGRPQQAESAFLS